MLKKMRGVFACGGNVEEDLDDDEDLYLLYDFNYRDYYYASID